MPSPPSIQLFAVHGNGGGASRFAALARHLPAGVQLTAEDLPGFGAAAAVEPLPDFAAYGDHVARRLEALPRPRVVLGHGIGGSIVLEMLQRHAGVVDAVLLHAPVGADLRSRKFPRLMRPRAMRWLARRALAARALRPFWRKRLFTAPVAPDLERAFFDGYRNCPGFSPMFDWIDAAWFEGLRPIDLPATLLWGSAERVLSADQARAFLPVLPRARIREIPGWGHFPMLEQPRRYAEEIADAACAALGPRQAAAELVP